MTRRRQRLESPRLHGTPARCGLLGLLGVLGLFSSAMAPALEIRVGHSRLIETDGISRVALADGDLAEVEVLDDGAGVLIIGRAPGQTDLRLWSGAGESRHLPVTVRARRRDDTDARLERLAARIEGIRLGHGEQGYYITGEPAGDRARQRLARLIEAYPELDDFTDAPGMAQTPSVQVKARFVELRKSALREIGLDWATRSPGISFAYASDVYTNEVFRGSAAPFLPADALPLDIGEGNGYLGIGLSLTAMIDLLGQSGEARVIAEPMLSALSGSSAEFQAGGELPIPVQGDDGNTSVTFKDYGILLKVAPVVGADRLIRTAVEVEVSDVDESVSVLGVPGFSVRNAVTEMTGRSGETLLIAGLVDEQQSRSVNQVPGLGDLPVIGELFKSRRFQNQQTELVVLITPTLARAATATQPADALPDAPDTGRQRASDGPVQRSAGRLPLQRLGR